MSIAQVTLLLFGGLLLLLSLGVPVAFSLASISLLVTWIHQGTEGLFTIAMTTLQQITNPTLMAIPMFLLMGNFLVYSGISDRMFRSLNYWLFGIRGGLSVVSICVCVALAMTGGFGPGIITMGLIAVPAMLKRKYDKKLAVGSVMAGAVLGQVIPPSIVLIILAYVGRISVGRLFFAAFIPGFVCALFYITYVLLIARLKPHLAPRSEEAVTWSIRWISLKEVIAPIILILLVLGSIFFGIATPTEAAGVGASGTFLICLIYRKLSMKILITTCHETLKVIGMVLWILIAATFFGMVYSGAGAQSMVMEFIQVLDVNRWAILIGMQIILLIAGAFMDDFAIITICIPIFLPIAKSLGFDPIWFAVIFVLNIQVAYLTPPFGWALIMMKGVAPSSLSTAEM